MLKKVIAESCEFLRKADVGFRAPEGKDVETVKKLVERIDLFKYQGLTGGEAAEKFGDFLGFLCIPYSPLMQEFFAQRWSDSVVWSDIPESMRDYYVGGEQLFTLPRLEASTVQTPFYQNGIPSVNPGDNQNPHNGGTVRRAPPLDDRYSNFIIHKFVPEHFYIEIPNTDVENVLKIGLSATDEMNPHRLYRSIHQARGSLYEQLHQHHGGANKLKPHDFTLIEIDSYAIRLDNDYLYTKKLHAHKQGSRLHGFFYIGAIEPKALSISNANRVA